ncbi:MAG TPA: family 2 glycosyl transferase, partial [Flavisolibacter sp.]|nr:family 2 glycosyl transferase [Flavisolibacter sp.]
LFKKHPQLYRQRIQPSPMWRYYFIVGCVLLLSIGLFKGNLFLSGLSLFVWALLTVRFILKRLTSTQHTSSHIWEMIATSIAIPFISVYWHWYGAFKYRVLFI